MIKKIQLLWICITITCVIIGLLFITEGNNTGNSKINSCSIEECSPKESTTVIGPIVDEDGKAINGANLTVKVNDEEYRNITDNFGFASVTLPPYTLGSGLQVSVKKEGYYNLPFQLIFNDLNAKIEGNIPQMIKQKETAEHEVHITLRSDFSIHFYIKTNNQEVWTSKWTYNTIGRLWNSGAYDKSKYKQNNYTILEYDVDGIDAIFISPTKYDDEWKFVSDFGDIKVDLLVLNLPNDAIFISSSPDQENMLSKKILTWDEIDGSIKTTFMSKELTKSYNTKVDDTKSTVIFGVVFFSIIGFIVWLITKSEEKRIFQNKESYVSKLWDLLKIYGILVGVFFFTFFIVIIFMLLTKSG